MTGQKSNYRTLKKEEIDFLLSNNNISDNWSLVSVSENFDPALIRNSMFSGPVYLGSFSREYNNRENLHLAVGVYNSHISSAIIEDNVSIHNVSYLSNIQVGKESILFNIGEISTSEKAVFGQGLWLDVANENGGKRIMSFEGMREADAMLWSSHKEDSVLMERLQQMAKDISAKTPAYGQVGAYSVIKHVKNIEDCLIGTCAYISGADALKNLTINSAKEEPTFIGNSVELSNGIIGFGTKILSGAKCFDFMTGRNVTIKLAARVLHSYVGSNSTIACCEVLHNLIFPFHEQHHNNSFLIASTVCGQSNIAAGATIGSNHNSRAADGEIVCGRGFWPGLNTSFKHNSFFAAFSLIAKASYDTEMHVKLPFSLISKNKEGNLQIFPGFWFRHNMYALARNTWKFADRDKRFIKNQTIEFDYLAPDTLWEMLGAINILEGALDEKEKREIFAYDTVTDVEDIYLPGIVPNEKVHLIKPLQGLWLYKAMIAFKAAREIVNSWTTFVKLTPLNISVTLQPQAWSNLGGQPVSDTQRARLIKDIRSKKLDSWQAVHKRYDALAINYPQDKTDYAIACYLEVVRKQSLNTKDITDLLRHLIKMEALILQWTIDSRRKDYTNEFRKMVYKNEAEMVAVMGPLENNTFINSMKKSTEKNRITIEKILEELNG